MKNAPAIELAAQPAIAFAANTPTKPTTPESELHGLADDKNSAHRDGHDLTLLERRLDRMEEALCSIAASLHRLAERFAPITTSDIVSSRYLADKLGCTTQWIGDMARNGVIPKSCIVDGTGTGKPWKFFKNQIDRWLKNR
ncbi:MAG TPA: hypothetical protein VMG10_19270 [Gemmataceae bacterium]|nr:hypothetical protein [Gemmataceae bacterium]